MRKKKWHYVSDDKKIGPISDETIQEMLDTGVINSDTLIWTEGLENWEPVRNVDQFNSDSQPDAFLSPQTTNSSSEEIQIHEISGPQIRPWVRYWARTMDIFLWSFLFGIPLVLIYPPALELNDILWGILILFAYMPVESIMLSSWGTTPGKALLRIRLRKLTGNKLTYAEALTRSFNVGVKGMGIGIPLIALITLIAAYKNLTKNRITTWDKDGNSHVSHKTVGAIRIIVTILFFFIAFIFFVLGSQR